MLQLFVYVCLHVCGNCDALLKLAVMIHTPADVTEKGKDRAEDNDKDKAD